MSVYRGRTAIAAAALSPAVPLAACGQAEESADSGGTAPREGGFTVGLLFSQTVQTRWEKFDKPLIEKKLKELCEDCAVEYANAKGDVATQQQKVDTLINKGVKVLVLSAVNFRSLSSSVERAHDAGIPVVAYDGLVEGPISAHVSFDNERVGKLQGNALLKALGDRADGGQVVMMNGPQTSPTNVAFKKGAPSVLEGKVKIGKTYDIQGWRQEDAHTNMARAISALGADSIDGVYAANDGLASGVISALEAAGIEPLPPVTGQDAELAAVQRIISGEQYMSVYKPFRAEAAAAAELAVALGRCEKLDDIAETTVDTRTTKDIPAVLLDPIAVTVDNIEDRGQGRRVHDRRDLHPEDRVRLRKGRNHPLTAWSASLSEPLNCLVTIGFPSHRKVRSSMSATTLLRFLSNQKRLQASWFRGGGPMGARTRRHAA